MSLTEQAAKPAKVPQSAFSPVDTYGSRRRMHKRKTFEKRVVLTDLKEGRLDTAMVQDISAGGACMRLDTEQWQHIPLNFMMLLTPDGAVKRLCEMIWRENRMIGVKFILPKKPKVAPRDPSLRKVVVYDRPAASEPQPSKLFISAK
jgi:hypothetical protein